MSEPAKKRRWVKPLVGLVVVAIIVALYLLFGDTLNLDYLATKEAALRDYQTTQPVLVYGIAFLAYVAVTGFSLPFAGAMTLLYGWLFGLWSSVVMLSFAATLGATIAFLISRYVLRESIQSKFGDRLQVFNRALERDGAFYLFTLRLIPAVPFFVINLVMGITPIRAWTYWWVSQLGMLPGTFVYVYAGAAVPDLATLSEEGAKGILTPEVIVAFTILAIFPFVVRFVMKKIRPPKENSSEAKVVEKGGV